MPIESLLFAGLRKLALDTGGRDVWAQPPVSLGVVNVIIGPNGGGKSTVADMVRSLSDPALFGSLVRENMQADTSAGMRIALTGRRELRLSFSKVDMDIAELAGAIFVADKPIAVYTGELDIREGIAVEKGLIDFIEMTGAKIAYRARHDEAGVSPQAWVDALNRHAWALNGSSAFPLHAEQPAYETAPTISTQRLAIALRDESSVHLFTNDDHFQSNHVRIAQLPSGWRAFGGLLGWLAMQEPETVCVIEEPETHMHPTLQRLAMREMTRIAAERKLQLVITTHSAVLIDVATADYLVKLFDVDGWRFRPLTDRAATVRSLGHRPSDLCLANGIVWVEGPSDRLYLLHWLGLWCKQEGVPAPEENVDFAFSTYGGAPLNHFSAASAAGLIDMLTINPNIFVLVDRDLDFVTGVDGTVRAVNDRSIKSRVVKEVTSHGLPNRQAWVTQGYTLESYLPDTFRKAHFETIAKRLRVKGRRAKVDIAIKFSQVAMPFRDAYDPKTNLPDLIGTLYATIKQWCR